MTYQELVNSLTAQFDESEHDINKYIRLVETRLNSEIFSNKDVRTVTLPERVDPATQELTGTFTLPSDYRRSLLVKINGKDGEFLSPEQYTYSDYYCDGVYTIIGNEVHTKTGSEVELTYYQFIPTVIDTSPNWILTNYSGAYASGCDYEASIYLYEDSRIQLFKQRYDEQMALLNKAVTQETWGIGSTLATRAM